MSPHDSASYFLGIAMGMFAVAMYGHHPTRKQLVAVGLFFVAVGLAYKFGYLS